MFIVRRWRECLIAILSLVVTGCYYFWPAPVTPEVRVVEKEKVVEKIVTKTRIQKPDGTIIDKIEDLTKVTKIKSDKQKVAGKGLPRYEALVLLPLRAPTAVSQAEIVVGARLGSSPASAFAGYDFGDKTVKIGVGVTW